MFHLDCVLELLVEVVASLKGGIEVVVHPVKPEILGSKWCLVDLYQIYE